MTLKGKHTADGGATAGSTAMALAVVGLVAFVCLTACPVGSDPIGPDNPRKHYWLRNSGDRTRELGAMDPALKRIADAFGAGDHRGCRALGQALLSADPDPGRRAGAMGFLIESHLAEGDFGTARAVAERAGDRRAVARIVASEGRYNAEVARLQHIVATAEDPHQAAGAQLLTARTHQTSGRSDLAMTSYRKVIANYPFSSQSEAALAQLAVALWSRGDQHGTWALCEQAIDRTPDLPLGVQGCRLLFTRFIPPLGNGHEEMRQRLLAVAGRHPGALTADAARFGIGQLCMAQGIPEAAEREWAELLAQRAGHMMPELERETRVHLAHVRYERALAASSRGDLEAAIEAMELVADELVWDRSPRGPLFLLGSWYETQGKHDDALRVRRRLLSVSETKEDKLAAKLWLAVSLRQSGRPDEALELLTSILREMPSGYLAAQSREEIQLIRNPPEPWEHEGMSLAGPE